MRLVSDKSQVLDFRLCIFIFSNMPALRTEAKL